MDKMKNNKKSVVALAKILGITSLLGFFPGVMVNSMGAALSDAEWRQELQRVQEEARDVIDGEIFNAVWRYKVAHGGKLPGSLDDLRNAGYVWPRDPWDHAYGFRYDSYYPGGDVLYVWCRFGDESSNYPARALAINPPEGEGEAYDIERYNASGEGYIAYFKPGLAN